MNTHHIKCCPQDFLAVLDGSKAFDVQKADCGYRVGDTLILEEYDEDNLVPYYNCTNNKCERKVTYIHHGGQFGIEAGYVVMGLSSSEFGKEIHLDVIL